MKYLDELVLDLVALVLVAAGLWLVFPPVALVVGGVGVFGLSMGLRARRKAQPEAGKAYKAIEREA